MKRKKQKSSTTTTTDSSSASASASASSSTSASASTSTTISTTISAAIQEHSLFFDHLVSLIPAKFYLPNDDADSKPWFKGLSKIAKASLKQQTRQNIKLARRIRHDPEKASQSSTLDLLKQSLSKPELTEETDTEIPDIAPIGEDNESVTYEELRQRLRRKIESLRGNRGGEKAIKTENEGNSNRNSNSNRRRESVEKSGEEKKRKRDNAEEVVEEEIEFGKVRVGDEEKGGRKKRKMPKAKELERVRRLEEMKRENPAVAKRESWKAATSRAYGAKVHDDPKLLKESIKKDQRKRVKNAEKWKERVERTTKMKSDRQQKRTDNIAERARDKKARKIAKREKKLMRPGFEGRKEGYITKE